MKRDERMSFMPKIIYKSPDDFGYQDRKMVKWMGMMLSDHTDRLTKHKKNRQQSEQIHSKAEQADHEKANILATAYLNKTPVAIQINAVTNGTFSPDIHALVLGQNDDRIFLKLQDDSLTEVTLTQIWHIAPLPWDIWYDQSPN